MSKTFFMLKPIEMTIASRLLYLIPAKRGVLNRKYLAITVYHVRRNDRSVRWSVLRSATISLPPSVDEERVIEAVTKAGTKNIMRDLLNYSSRTFNLDSYNNTATSRLSLYSAISPVYTWNTFYHHLKFPRIRVQHLGGIIGAIGEVDEDGGAEYQ